MDGITIPSGDISLCGHWKIGRLERSLVSSTPWDAYWTGRTSEEDWWDETSVRVKVRVRWHLCNIHQPRRKTPIPVHSQAWREPLVEDDVTYECEWVHTIKGTIYNLTHIWMNTVQIYWFCHKNQTGQMLVHITCILHKGHDPIFQPNTHALTTYLPFASVSPVTSFSSDTANGGNPAPRVLASVERYLADVSISRRY
jgi:hypothetical protein